MESRKLSLKPPGKSKEELQEDFLKGARGSTHIDMYKPEYPWNDPKLRDDIIKQFNIRMPEKLLEKLRYIITHGKLERSINTYLRNVVEEAIERDLEKLLKEQK